jgi:DNA gyrase subunit A
MNNKGNDKVNGSNPPTAGNGTDQPVAEAPALDPNGSHLPTVGFVKPRKLEIEVQESYLDYAMSVIVARALPDVRDGLKPVHRRILFAMHEMGLKAGSKHTKSAKIVGEVLGKYHPHGDVAVYDTLVRMAQPFSMRGVLVDGQGNFGSLDGDAPAAMRYTEAKLTKLAEEMLLDIDKETVDWSDNYDATLKEPRVLPAKIPNLLVNGALGIAVGMATNIPTHNMGEVVDGTIALIDHPDITVDELIELVKGPDFPTGGVVYGLDDIKTAYATGKGSIVMRAKADIEEVKNGYRIIVSEIPYQVNKADLIAHIAELVQAKKMEGISDIRDESDRKEQVRIVIELKSTAYPKKVLNRLYELTTLQSTFHVNMLALVDGLQPKILTLKEVLQYHTDHRFNVVTKRSEYELKKARERAHILEGLKKALDFIDEIIQLIKKSATREDAHVNLVKKYSLTDVQAEAILEMKLSQLAGLERKKIEDELTDKKRLIAHLESLLSDRKKIFQVIKDELMDLKSRFADSRRTRIVKNRVGEFTAEDLIPNEYVVVTLTKGNYVKRVPVGAYRSQGRGGRGVMGAAPKEEDVVEHLLTTWTHNDIMFFTDKGRVFTAKVYDLPAGSRQSKGQALVNLIQIAPDEKVTTVISVDAKANNGQKYFFMATEKGVVKKTEIDDYRSVRRAGLIAVKLTPGDSLGWVMTTTGNDTIVMTTRDGQAISFGEEEVRPMGRSATGVRGIKLKPGSEVMTADVVRGAKPDLLVVSAKGLGKRTALSEFKEQHRGGMGMKAMNMTDKTGNLVEARVVSGDQGDVAIVSEQGIVIRMPMKAVKRLGRATQGVRLMRLGQGDRVASVAVIDKSQNDEEAVEPAPVTPPPKSTSKKAGEKTNMDHPHQSIDDQPDQVTVQPEEEERDAPVSAEGNPSAKRGYVVKTYTDESGRVRRVVEPSGRKKASDSNPSRESLGLEGDKNYWGGDVWKKRK